MIPSITGNSYTPENAFMAVFLRKCIKGTVQRYFQFQFFSSIEPAWAMGKNILDFVLDFAKLFNFLKISLGNDTPASQSPKGFISPGEALMTPGSQQPFLNTFAHALKGIVSPK